MIREAQRAIADRQPRLLLLGTPEQFGSVPDGMTVIPIACQSEGALEVYVEPVLASPHLVVIGAIADGPHAAGPRGCPRAGTWSSSTAPISPTRRSTPGPWWSSPPRATVTRRPSSSAVAARPVYLGLVASRRRGESVLGYLADRGVPQDVLERIRVPAGLDLGHTSHREIAVAVLAELVQLRAAGVLVPEGGTGDAATAPATPAEAVDPICGMTVPADDTSRPFEHGGVTYYFCSAGCRSTFERDPAAHVPREARC